MKIFIRRSYLKMSTTGDLYIDGHYCCKTLELPWKDNQRSVSCIPEGTYKVKSRYSTKFGEHLLVEGVPDRSYILFHPANDVKELEGCIAPVEKLTSSTTGIFSQNAFQQILFVVLQAKKEGKRVKLIIEG
ncbi:DUF5675 family protein [Zhouia amylolytica]|uniref:DUF5675 family protein n=1 Tax=Zhouia amylolytica TaxID=376730 RepID=UPI00056F4268|nr:DUF5675 family protein [Zhouia amylolytica]